MASDKLVRHFGFWTLLFYGVGDILGAGIYALIGKVAKTSGTHLWMSFGVALCVVVLTALSYAELCGRFPKSGGVAHFSDKAFSKKWLSFISGWLLFCTSIFSMATISRSFVGYIHSLGFGIPGWILIAGFLLVLGLINLRGIKESSGVNILSTTVEVSGLAFVIFAALYYLKGGTPVVIEPTELQWGGVLEGAALAFFAFIGFEDIANVAEEVKEPEKNLPRAIVSAVAITGVIYLVVAWLSAQVVDPGTLAQSDAALAVVVKTSGFEGLVSYFAIFALFAITNTCLLNAVTASRLLYGMSEEKLIPSQFSKVHPKFKTPHIAVLVVAIVAYAMTFVGDLRELAGTTSLLILLVFTITNFSLVKIKWGEQTKVGKTFSVPVFVPLAGFIINIAFMFFIPGKGKALVLVILLIGFICYKLISQKAKSQPD